MTDHIRNLAFEKAFQLFDRTVRTSDPEEIVRYAKTFESYLKADSIPYRTLERRLEKIKHASDDLGWWMSAALDDPNVCDEMKQDIQVWFGTLENIETENENDDQD